MTIDDTSSQQGGLLSCQAQCWVVAIFLGRTEEKLYDDIVWVVVLTCEHHPTELMSTYIQLSMCITLWIIVLGIFDLVVWKMKMGIVFSQ